MNISNLIQELKRRNVIKVATAYVIAGWIIIQVSDIVFPRLGLPEWTVTFIIALVGIGLPISLIFAWAFELTPEGLKKSKEVEITKSVTDRTGKKLNGVIIGVLSVALFFVVIERVFFATSGMVNADELSISNASIAVLPFADLSPDGDQEYFSDGLSEELLNVLAKVEDMKVAGRTSSFKFKGMNEDLKLIGDQLGVDHILEGSVRKAGNTIRITAQLIKVEDGFHMWSETYDREYTAENIFRIQDEISQMVLNELKVRLLTNSEPLASDEKIPTEDIEAYEAFLRGKELMVDRNPDEILQAIDQFKRASEIDPSFAQAYAYLSFSYARLYDYGNIDKDEVSELIRSNADRALFMNSDIPRAYAGLSAFYEIKDDTLNSINAIKKAYDLNPNDAEMVNSYGATLSRYEEKNPDFQERSDSLITVAHQLDPLNPVIATNVAQILREEKDFDKAFELLDKVIENNPDYLRAYTQKIYILRSEGFGLRDQDFMEAYKGYNKNPESLNFITLLRESATYFNLDSLEIFLSNEVIRLYPNNPSAVEAQGVLNNYTMSYLMDNKEFEKARVFAEENFADLIEQNPVIFERFFSNAETTSRLSDYMENEEFEKAFEIFPLLFPEYLSDTLTTHVGEPSNTAMARYLFSKLGREDLVQNLDKLKYEYPDWANFKFDKDITKEDPGSVYALALESLYNRDIERAIEIIEELYFNRKYKYYQWNDYFEEPPYVEFMENEKLKELIDRVEADQKSMKENVVAFLKEEGAWKESWEEKEE